MCEVATKLLEENIKLQEQIRELKTDLIIESTTPIDKSSLYQKKAQVMAAITGKVPESGKHQQGWKYSTSEDVKDALRSEMGKVGLVLSFEVISHEIIREEARVIVTALMAYTLQCAETGVTETKVFPAEAVDFGKNTTAEKTFYKLYTTSEKYFLKTTFLIASGDELDSDAIDTPPRPVKKVDPPKNSPPAWLPTFDEFMEKALSQFPGLTDQDIKDELKEAGYQKFVSAQASIMLDALSARSKKEKSKA